MTSILGYLMQRVAGTPQACTHCLSVLEWLKGQPVTSTAVEFGLPFELAHLSATGSAFGLRTADGRHVALLKTSIGWKENFEGVLCADAPLRPPEIVASPKGRAYVSIGDDPVFQELYIRRRYGDACFAVYFDLN